MGLMMLAAGPGSTLDIAAKGIDADTALQALTALVDDGFGEIPDEDTEAQQQSVDKP